MNAAFSRLAALLAAGAMAMLAGAAGAQPAGPASPASRYGEIPAPAQPGEIPLPTALKPGRLPEQWSLRGADRAVRNVTAPTLTPVLPAPGKATGAAVIIAPGGAFYTLFIDNEGYKVARWLADRGIAAFVLKYRTQETPRDPNGFSAVMSRRMGSIPTEPIDAPPEALEDAKAAVRLVRSRAAEWGVDPGRVGFAGFSAGAITALNVGLTADQAVRPDFIAPIYPQMAARPVPSDAPPMFVAIALDDPLFAKGKALGLINSWRDAGRPVEAHLYERGGHGFGASSRFAASAMWMDEFYAWMKDRGLLRPAPR